RKERGDEQDQRRYRRPDAPPDHVQRDRDERDAERDIHERRAGERGHELLGFEDDERAERAHGDGGHPEAWMQARPCPVRSAGGAGMRSRGAPRLALALPPLARMDPRPLGALLCVAAAAHGCSPKRPAYDFEAERQRTLTYTVGPGDVLQVRAWKNEALSQ